MSRIRRANTKPELTIRRLLHARGLRFQLHVSALPGCPDVVFAGAGVAVFIDGDFWHGWRFPRWRHKLAPYWKAKIARNRERDQRTFRRLRHRGWVVLRIWEHQIERDPAACVARVLRAVLPARGPPHVNTRGSQGSAPPSRVAPPLRSAMA